MNKLRLLLISTLAIFCVLTSCTKDDEQESTEQTEISNNAIVKYVDYYDVLNGGYTSFRYEYIYDANKRVIEIKEYGEAWRDEQADLTKPTHSHKYRYEKDKMFEQSYDANGRPYGEELEFTFENGYLKILPSGYFKECTFENGYAKDFFRDYTYNPGLHAFYAFTYTNEGFTFRKSTGYTAAENLKTHIEYTYSSKYKNNASIDLNRFIPYDYQEGIYPFYRGGYYTRYTNYLAEFTEKRKPLVSSINIIEADNTKDRGIKNILFTTDTEGRIKTIQSRDYTKILITYY